MINSKSLQKNLTRFGEMDGALLDRIQSLPVHQVRKGTLLLKEGDICDKGFHIVKGMLRVFYLKDGKEITSRFAEEGDACISYWSFYKQEPSFEYIDCVEDCTLTIISYEQLQGLYDDFPEFNRVMRIGMENSHIKSEERARIIRSLPALERYEKMKELYPNVFLKARMEQIATFLGLTRESLSRIISNVKKLERAETLKCLMQGIGIA